MTREDDTFISLRDRSCSANKASADLFLSIHANAAESSELWGVETYSLNTSSDVGASRVAARENKVAREYKKEKVDSNRLGITRSRWHQPALRPTCRRGSTPSD